MENVIDRNKITDPHYKLMLMAERHHEHPIIKDEDKITGNGGNKVKIFVTGARGNWRAAFKIGVQTFYVCDRSTKAEALWFCKCLRAAFKNLKS